MSEIYHILNDEEMDKTITVEECRNLRKVINILTTGPLLKKKEYVRIMVVINSILNRMEKVGENEDKTDSI